MAIKTVEEYMLANPDWKPTAVDKLRYSGGLMLLITLDGVGHFRWDELNTQAYRNHHKKDPSDVFYKWLKKHMINHIWKNRCYPTATFYPVVIEKE